MWLIYMDKWIHELNCSSLRQATLKTKMAEKDKHAKELVATTEKKFTERLEQNKNQITALEKKVKTLSAAGAVGGAKAGGAKVS